VRKPHEILALARLSLAAFGAAMRPAFDASPGHVRILMSRLEAIERGEIKRLIISEPPRHGKSYTTTEIFPAWYLGRNPTRYVISSACTQELSDKFGRSVRNLMLDPRFGAIFPTARLSQDSAAASRFSTRSGGEYFGIGRGGAVLGRGADVLLIDDPLRDAQEAGSANIREQLHQWFSEVAYTRLQPGAAVIVISTRWHEDDLAGWLLREHPDEGWRVLSLPAIAERDEGWRKEGEALWPDRYPLSALRQIRSQIGGPAFASQYQQRPSAAEGAVFKRNWWQYWKGETPRLSRIIQSWDTAFKTGAENDYSACTTWGEAADGYLLLHAWKERVEFPELKRKVESFGSKWNPNAVLVEDKASGQSLIQELQRGTKLPILPIKVDTDKLARAQAVTPLIEAGRVYLPESAPWLDDLLDELATFPNAAHDDLTDSVTQALNYLRQGPDTDLVFRPEDIERAFTDQVKPLFPEDDDEEAELPSRNWGGA
jgi:predicted phage terminase large subunit-like protein